MSKNLTRKGIAFGAIVALGTTLFAGAPASAAGIDNGNVSLAPNAGAEYDVIAGATFKLKANFANAARTSGAFIKLLVADSSQKVTATSGQYGAITVSSIANAGADIAVSGQVVTMLVNNDDLYDTNDYVKVTVATALTGGAGLAGTYPVTAIDRTANTISYTVPAGTTVADATGGTLTVQPATITNRSTDKSFVIDTKSDSNSADKVFALTSTDEDSTQTVTATAWVDTNDNNEIDTTEYQSPARTIRFLKHSDVSAALAFNPIAVGSDSTVVAKVTLTPTLNGAQLVADYNRNGDANVLAVNFTRPGSTATLASASTSYSNTTKQWTVTSVNMNNAAADDVEVAGTTNTGWNISQPVSANLYLGKVSITKDVVTATTAATGSRGTAAAHGLQVGDMITIASSTTARADITTATKVLSVPSTTTFTYAAAATGADLAATDQAAGAITVTKILRNYAVAGTYSGQVLLYKDSADALTKLGSAVASTGVAVTASTASIESVASATVSATVSNAASVFTGTKTAAFVGKVLDADGAAVGAGLDAAITATTVTSAGTVKINGTTVVTGTVVYAKTDANGQVAISVENSSALAGESIVLDLDIQGVDATDVTATWADKVYSIVDLNDPSAVSTPARTRAVADGASYTFNLVVQDQFKAVAGADIRLKAVITGRSASTQIVPLTAGKASITVADAGLATTGDSTLALTFQKLSSGVWGDVDSLAYADWNGAASEDEDTVAIKYYTQTDALALNADAANYPSSTAADFAAATTTKSLVAVDARVSNTTPTAVVAAGKAVVSGSVTNSTTGAAKSGQVVSVTGAGLLFKSGDVWSIGSASAIAADGTFAVEVYSNNPGTKVVTVTSGSLTKTASLVFTGASSAVRKLTVSGSQKVLPGSTLQAAILLVDGNGNAVDTTAPATTPASEYISVSYEGPGLLSGSALPAETDKDGKASVRYLLGTGDRGVATVTVKFDANYDGDFVDATDITVVREYLIGVSAKITKAATSSTVVKNALGATIKVVRGSKVTTKVATSNSQKVSVKGGKGTVNVYVNGVKVASK